MRVNISSMSMRIDYAYIQNINSPDFTITNSTGALIYIDSAREVAIDQMTVLFIYCNITSCPTTCNGRIIYYNSDLPLKLSITNSLFYCNSSSNFILYTNNEKTWVQGQKFTQGSPIYLNSQNSKLTFRSFNNQFQFCTVAEKGGAIRIQLNSIAVQSDIQIQSN